jgi:hypothetical protein
MSAARAAAPTRLRPALMEPAAPVDSGRVAELVPLAAPVAEGRRELGTVIEPVGLMMVEL